MNNIGRLDWSDWVLGLWAAIIQGGSSAVLSASGLIIIDPKDFNAGEGKLWAIAGGMFLWNGVLGMLGFLRSKPVPTVKTEIQQIATSATGTVTETSVQQTTITPVKR